MRLRLLNCSSPCPAWPSRATGRKWHPVGTSCQPVLSKCLVGKKCQLAGRKLLCAHAGASMKQQSGCHVSPCLLRPSRRQTRGMPALGRHGRGPRQCSVAAAPAAGEQSQANGAGGRCATVVQRAAGGESMLCIRRRRQTHHGRAANDATTLSLQKSCLPSPFTVPLT